MNSGILRLPSRARHLPVWLGSAAAGLALLFDAPQTRAQFYNPKSDTPLVLLDAPTDPLQYLALKLRLRELVTERKGAEAEALAEQLVAAYPRDGENWFLLARAKKLVGKDLEAASAYREVARYMGGRGVEFPHLPARRYSPEAEAAAHLLATGDRRGALDLLRTAISQNRFPFPGQLLTWPEFEQLKEDPEFREIVNQPDPAGWSRDYGWRRDVHHIYETIKLVNPDYRDRPLPHEFVERYEALIGKVPVLTDEEIFVEMNRMIAALHQGHSWLLGFPEGHPANRSLPIRFYVFPEGIFVSDADANHMHLVGSRLISIGSTPAEEALRLINQLQSVDGEMDYLKTGAELLSAAYILKGLGIIEDTNALTIQVQKGGSPPRDVRLTTSGSPAGSGLQAPPGVTPPMFLGNPDAAHWERHLPAHDALYVQMNRTFDGEHERLPDFGVRLRSVLAETRPSSLIIDLRHNGGGNTSLYREFLRTATGFSQLPETQVYVLIGRSTYSAAGNLITDLERLADPIFVGEASSQCCRFHGDANRVLLPYSGISGWLTAMIWNLSHNALDGRREMSPQIPVQLTAGDYFAGRDPILNVVYSHIAKRRTAPNSMP